VANLLSREIEDISNISMQSSKTFDLLSSKDKAQAIFSLFCFDIIGIDSMAGKMFENPIMDREYFRLLTDQFRSPHLWFHEKGQWKLRHTVWNGCQ
jgi:hypothetical protein